jgi:quinolinate synthase
MVSDEELIRQILELKKEKNAVVLVHNYQRPELYKIADHIGDSLGLSRQAEQTDADIIVFCGVEFMAETAKILSPEKKVLLPTFEAGCSLADMATAEELIKVKKKHPNAAVVSYVNTTAEVKDLSDACCTSMNAVKIIESLPQDEIIFLPDKNLAKYVSEQTSKKIIAWDGYCFVHNDLKKEMIQDMKDKFPKAKVIAHPECPDEVLKMADEITGTGGMAKFASSNDATDFIIATECGMTEKLAQDVPDKTFHAFCNICPYMKATTLPLVLEVLKEEKNQINVPEDIRIQAKRAIDRMLEIG